jgi:hypothetical protein
VPTTIAMFLSQAFSMLSKTLLGIEKSMATISLKELFLSKVAQSSSLSIIPTMVSYLLKAISSTIFPIFP